MAKRSALSITTIGQVYLIIALFIALIIILIGLIQIQNNALMAVRAYVGAEGLWAKAQKDATRSLEHYALSRNEDDYKTYIRFIQVPLGDSKSRIEMQNSSPNLDIVREGFLTGKNHPDDIEYMINFFLRFQHTSLMAETIEHWILADQFIEELNDEAEKLHQEISSGINQPGSVATLHIRLDSINRHLTEQENQFSSTLANASRSASKVSRNLIYVLALLLSFLGIGISWPIIVRIRATETALLKNEEDLRISATAFDSQESVMITDANSVILRVNLAFIIETGYTAGEVVGQTPRLLKSDRHTGDFYRVMWETILRKENSLTAARMVKFIPYGLPSLRSKEMMAWSLIMSARTSILQNAKWQKMRSEIWRSMTRSLTCQTEGFCRTGSNRHWLLFPAVI